jgi:hypothetical protein
MWLVTDLRSRIRSAMRDWGPQYVVPSTLLDANIRDGLEWLHTKGLRHAHFTTLVTIPDSRPVQLNTGEAESYQEYDGVSRMCIKETGSSVAKVDPSVIAMLHGKNTIRGFPYLVSFVRTPGDLLIDFYPVPAVGTTYTLMAEFGSTSGNYTNGPLIPDSTTYEMDALTSQALVNRAAGMSTGSLTPDDLAKLGLSPAFPGIAMASADEQAQKARNEQVGFRQTDTVQMMRRN